MILIMFAALLVAPVAVALRVQTSEDAHVQHERRLADTALNAQYRRTMDAMVLADRTRDDELKKGMTRTDGRSSSQAGLLAAERAWLAYRDAHCVTVGFAYRGGAYQDEAEGKCIIDLTRKRTLELKQLSDSLTH